MFETGNWVRNKYLKEIGLVEKVHREYPCWWSWYNWIYGPRPWQYYIMVEVKFESDGLSMLAPPEDWELIASLRNK